MKVLKHLWVINMANCIGMVVTENSVGKRKIRMANVVGMNEEDDIKDVAEYGGKVNITDLKEMIALVEGKE